LALGYQGGMEYMERNLDKRKDVAQILTDVKSVISLGMNYYTAENYSDEKDKGKVSRYAWGKDYHLVIWEKLEQLENELKEIDPEFKSKSYVDTGPVMDKAWAVRAGLGWLGKHTNVINKEIGSWFFIANIITNYEFDYSTIITDHCGSCIACIETCPTGAIVDEYVLDSNKCISYLTIENKGNIPEEFKDKFEGLMFGCDICQDVCPWNIKFFQVTANKDFLPQKENKEIDLKEILEMNEEKFNERFKESPIKRTKLKGLKRNAEFLM
jgi:epoxyqueuosine reductase